MALPILEVSKYETVVPSTGKRIQYRPFLVKEEKILLIAQESKDSQQIINALKDIINACTFEKLNVDELATYDLEYLFLQLRAKSVGETVNLELKCDECKVANPVSIDLSKVKVVQSTEKIESKIQLTDEIGVTVRPIPVKEINNLSEKAEDFVKMIGICIETIYDSNKIYNREDISEKEMITFVESLSRKQVEKIEKFISNQPKLSHKETFTCLNCKKKNVITLEGLQSFFT